MAGGTRSIRDSLSQWETSLAPLDESSREEFMKLSTTAGNRPLPQNVSLFTSILISGVSKVGHGRAFALPTAAESNFNTALKPFK